MDHLNLNVNVNFNVNVHKKKFIYNTVVHPLGSAGSPTVQQQVDAADKE